MADTDRQDEKGGQADEARNGAADAPGDFKVHLLDLGSGGGHQYGDCVLCQFGDVSVLIDGGHRTDGPIILPQLKRLLGQTSPVRVSLIVVTHPHDDHIGCLPRLVADGDLTADWALLTDPKHRWGEEGDTDNVFALREGRVRGVAEAVLEHDRADLPDHELNDFIDNLGNLETRYRMMIRRLRELGARVVLHGADAAQEAELLAAFAGVGLKIIGPTLEQLEECARLVRGQTDDAVGRLDRLFALDTPIDAATAYRSLVAAPTDRIPRNRGALNLQSIVTSFLFRGQRVIFGGDMQFSDPQVDSPMLIAGVARMRADMSADAPYAFIKLSHHGSDNGFSREMLEGFGDSPLYGICLGDARGHHPHPDILELLDEHREQIDWVRTDRNGQVTINIGPQGPEPPILTSGHIDDPTSNMHDDTDSLGGGAALEDAPQSDAPSARVSPPVRVEAAGPAREIYARVPANATRVNITVDLAHEAPQGAPSAGDSGAGDSGLGAAALTAALSADAEGGGAAALAADAPRRLGLPRATVVEQLNRTRSRGWLEFFNEAAREFNWPVALLLAIASRESNIQNILGDGGHGRGIMQIDDRSFPAFANSGRWRDPRQNILMGGRVLSGKRRFLAGRGVGASTITRASVAAYNSGEGNVLKAIRRGLSVDAFTAHRNYSADVLARAQTFAEVLG